MLPNAKLLASGPSAQGASEGGLVLNNLRRLDAGLRGEVLAPSLDIGSDGMGDDVMEGVEFESEKKKGGGEKGKGKGKEINVDDMWAEAQDINDYQREQSIGEGEIGAGQAGESMGMQETSEVVDTTRMGAVDKAARKAAKAARNKAERKGKK